MSLFPLADAERKVYSGTVRRECCVSLVWGNEARVSDVLQERLSLFRLAHVEGGLAVLYRGLYESIPRGSC